MATATTPKIMGQVVLALIPAMGVLVWLFGIGVLLNVATAAAGAAAAEAWAVRARGRSVGESFSDGSVWVTALIIGVALPPLLPWWIPAIAGALGVLLGKQVYGGLGQNVFNPAIVGYLAVTLAFPQAVGLWPPPDPSLGATVPSSTALHYFLTGALPLLADAFTYATPLDQLTTGGLSALELNGKGGTGIGATGSWIWLSAAFLVGGLFLLVRRVIDWRLPLGVIAGTAATAALLQLFGGAPIVFHLLSGATLIVAFFIATDPVTAPTSAPARWAYAAAIGTIAMVIRELGGHPDGFAYAVLMMNASAPLLDYIARRTGGR